jgi:hypothetical protein
MPRLAQPVANSPASSAYQRSDEEAVEPMVFQIVAMICVAGMQPQDCGPEPGYSRDVAIVGEVPNEIMCNIQAQWSLGPIATFQNLAAGEFIKIMCVRKA